MNHKEQLKAGSDLAVHMLHQTAHTTVNSRIMILTHMVALVMLHVSKSPRSAAALLNEVMVPAIEQSISNYENGATNDKT